MKTNFDYLLGSDPTCDLPIRRPGIAARHARLKRIGDRLFVQDLSSRTGVSVNGLRIIGNKWIEITRYDLICLGRNEIELGAGLFFGRERLGINSTPLWFRSNRGKVICDGVHIRANPGSLTAIMGPSGCGKSVFLNLLNGNLRPSEGEVYFGDNRIELSRELESLGSFIGYVPQSEILIPELSVEESLRYTLLLKFPDMKRQMCIRLIRQVCDQIGFRGERLEKILKTRIGQSGERGAVLSGGERRRISIAHELITQPLVLFLDEPTSGLSSVDSDEIVGLLKSLAQDSGITVVTTIHQPSCDSFFKFDNLLLMDLGGKLRYLGRIEGIPAKIGVDLTQGNPAETLLKTLHSGDLNHLTIEFENDFLPLSSKQTEKKAANSEKWWVLFRGGPMKSLAQFFTLTVRNLTVFFRDQSNLLFTWGQVPLIALLILIGFTNSAQIFEGQDTLFRTLWFFSEIRENESGMTIPDAVRKASELAAEDQSYLSEPGARQQSALYFVIALCSIWFGLLGSCREIVLDQWLIQKECKTGVSLISVFFSKLLIQSIIGVVQVLLILILLQFVSLLLNPVEFLKLFTVAVATVVSAVTTGMLLSSIASSYRTVLTMIPLVMIPQVLFGGLLTRTSNTQASEVVSWLTMSRWSFQEALTVDERALGSVLEFEAPQAISSNILGASNLLEQIVSIREVGTSTLFFPVSSGGIEPFFALLTISLVSIAIALIVIKFRFSI